MIFLDRAEAGQRLADRLQALGMRDPAVVALPPGGVRIGYEIATRLGAPMDVVVAHRVIMPGASGAILGAVAGGHFHPDERTLRARDIPREYAALLAGIETERQDARTRGYRPHLEPLDLSERPVILVDDGATCEMSAFAAVHALRARGARQILYAAPVVPPPVFTRLVEIVEFVTLYEPMECRSVNLCYETFSQTTVDEAADLLARTRAAEAPVGV